MNWGTASGLVSFCACLLHFRAADWYYGLYNNYTLFKMLGTWSVSDLEILYALDNFHAQSCTKSWCFCYLYHCCNKIHNRKQLGKVYFFLIVSYSSWGDKIHCDINTWWWECKRESHSTGTQDAERETLVPTIHSLLYLFVQFGNTGSGMVLPILGVDLPLTDMQRNVFLEGAKFSLANSED